MKNATPSEKRKGIALEEIDNLETENIAQKYRKLAGIQYEDFDCLIEELGMQSRNEVLDELLSSTKIGKAFNAFWNKLIKEKKEYQGLLSQDDWRYAIAELFFFGEIQPDTIKTLNFVRVFWVDNVIKKTLMLKILPGATKKEIIDFINLPENNIVNQFNKIGIVSITSKTRTSHRDTYSLDFWVRVLDSFSSQEIRETFQEKFPQIYKNKFAPNGKDVHLSRAKYNLISEYLFHRFNLKTPKGKSFSEEYIKTIAEKSKKNKTQIKKGLSKKIP